MFLTSNHILFCPYNTPIKNNNVHSKRGSDTLWGLTLRICCRYNCYFIKQLTKPVAFPYMRTRECLIHI